MQLTQINEKGFARVFTGETFRFDDELGKVALGLMATEVVANIAARAVTVTPFVVVFVGY